MEKQSSNMCSSSAANQSDYSKIRAYARRTGHTGSTEWSRRAQFMSATTAGHHYRPEKRRTSQSQQGAEGLHGPHAGGRASGPAGKPPRLRLTRRGRIVLIGLPLVLLAALLLSLAGLLNSPAKAADTASGLSVTETVSVTVQSGESLW